MNEDIIERLEKIGSEMLALAAGLKRQNLPPKVTECKPTKQKDVLLKTLLKKGVPARTRYCRSASRCRTA